MRRRLAIFLAAAVVAAGLVALRPGGAPAPARSADGCRTSMRTLVSAIGLYRNDQSRPPEQLEQLVPRYLDRLPPCPAEKKETYSSTYQVYGQKFSLFCRDTATTRSTTASKGGIELFLRPGR